MLLSAQDLRHYEKPPKDSINRSSITHLSIHLPSNSDTPRQVGAGQSPIQPFTQWLKAKLLLENLILIQSPTYTFTIDPIFNNYIGQDLISGKNIWGNTRGLRAQGIINLSSTISSSKNCHPELDSGPNNIPPKSLQSFPKLEFSTSYLEAQSVFTPYLDSIVRYNRVFPGEIYKGYGGGEKEHSHAYGHLRYSPNKTFSFEAGHGKNYLGNGYRSLLLSDAAPYYPYFRIDTKIWRLHYVNLWAELQDINFRDNFEDGFQKKYVALHYLSFAITNRLEISIFEAINWQGRDSTHHRGFDINYLNPIILLRPVEWTLGSPDNALLGFASSYKFGQSTYLYGQLLLDEGKSSELINWRNGWWANKIAYQVGFKTWIPLSLTKDEKRTTSFVSRHSSFGRHLFLQSEFNSVRPYTYTHVTSKQNYGHMNQSLAHPLGANFIEWVNFVRLRWDRLIIEGRYSWAQFGSDFNGSNYGHNIFLPYTTRESDYDVFIGNGLLNTLTYKTLTISYLLNPASNFNVFFKATDRHQVTELNDKHDLLVQFGVRSSVRNLYYDF